VRKVSDAGKLGLRLEKLWLKAINEGKLFALKVLSEECEQLAVSSDRVELS